MEYKNTQLGVVIFAIMSATFLLLMNATADPGKEPTTFIYVIIGVVALLFSTLTISVNDKHISWFFGPRFWRKSVDVQQVKSAKIVRTKWYYGLGIRLIPTGWLYNVSGLTAVELTLADGTAITLGTNDADNLLEAIEKTKAIS